MSNVFFGASINTLSFPKPLPPYGKGVAQLLLSGQKPANDIFVFAGLDGWRKAKAFKNSQIILCLPYGSDPADYFWPVDDCSVLLIDTGFLSVPDIEKTAYCLLNANAKIVRAILPDYKLVVYRRRAAA